MAPTIADQDVPRVETDPEEAAAYEEAAIDEGWRTSGAKSLHFIGDDKDAMVGVEGE